MEELYGESNLIVLPKKLEIPEIDNKRLRELYNLLKPIVTIDEAKYLLKKYTLQELRNQSYFWNRQEDKRNIVEPSKLETVEDFLCLHTWDYYGMFKPTVAEILSQAPEKVIEEANTFEIIEIPQTLQDIYKYKEVINNGYHLSKVRAYKMHQ
jgi:hypothetical protein